jgi:hypothetical protein
MINLLINIIRKFLFIFALICGAIWITGGFVWLPGLIYGFNPETRWPNCPGKDIFLLFIILPCLIGLSIICNYPVGFAIDQTNIMKIEEIEEIEESDVSVNNLFEIMDL